MKTEEYKSWLESSGATANACATRASSLRTIEQKLSKLGFDYDDLDVLIATEGSDRLRARIKELRENAKHGGQEYRILMPDSENPKNRLSNYSSWVAQYDRFLSGDPPELANDADRIRYFVLENYIEPARESGEASIEILVRAVNDALKLDQGWPNVCQAVKGGKFLKMAELSAPQQIGADNSPKTIFRFQLNDSTSRSSKRSFVFFDSQGQSYEPVRQKNRSTGVTAFSVKPSGASNRAEDALALEDIKELAKAMLIQHLAARIQPTSGGPINYLTFGGSKLVRYELDPAIAAEIGVPPAGGERPSVNESDGRDAMQRNRTELSMTPTNLILYGPPGTGKTYRTAEKALELCGETIPQTRKELMVAYRRLQNAGQIEFITFHQSMSYEDFVEGRQPVTGPGEDGIENVPTGDNGGFRLETRPGIFRRISKRAETSRGKVGQEDALSLEGRNVFKMSLGEAKNPEDAKIFENAIDGGYAVLGFEDIDWSDPRFASREEMIAAVRETGGANAEADARSGAVQMPYIFRNWVKPGDIVLASKGNSLIRAIGEFTGEYEFSPRLEGDYAHKRKVRWLWVDREGIPVSEVYPRNFTMKSIYLLDDKDINRAALERLMNSRSAEEPIDPDPFVLIIDEINRANISKVFGELITLLEPDKRLGKENEIRLRLPYSPNEEFGVPANLHIIGTMNTADRSIALLDTALRRRFSFEEMMPSPKALEGVGATFGVDLPRLLTVLNDRIEYLYDREHQIGHAYFINCRDRESLDETMRHKVIPLLAEYFFEDWDKVAAVLGDLPEQERDHVGGFLACKQLKAPTGMDSEDETPRRRWSVKPGKFDYSGLVGE